MSCFTSPTSITLGFVWSRHQTNSMLSNTVATSCQRNGLVVFWDGLSSLSEFALCGPADGVQRACHGNLCYRKLEENGGIWQEPQNLGLVPTDVLTL